MKIVPFVNSDWASDHPLGTILFKHLLSGEPGSPDNFMYILGRQDGDFSMPTHRHNFEQIRLPLRGAMDHGRTGVLRENEIGYFPEGLAYGPQNDPLGNTPPGERMQLVLQFGGASGYGFLDIERRRKARAELTAIGEFKGPFYHWPDGRKDWALSAIWERAMGSRLRYPHPRYRHPIFINPESFNWLALTGTNGVTHKFLGAFSERGVWIEMIRLESGAVWRSADPRGRRILTVLEGEGTVKGQPVGYLGTLQVESDETVTIEATQAMELFLVGLPPVELPGKESDRYDEEPMPDESTVHQ
ncbi:hypothetical protein OI25_5087 [Paraburkholderia fungorum]|uniref:Quercetin 2,3-dioxygenase n=1 Tax=Paraburkholderia fungorum TaxID=134537 RepID=A0AAW3UPE2_9BURK|nr:hypothetical protein [Paraburkholderia fungorum]AJZ63459.1 hypothetical protein OI25_5087 [Paraburkholderia fungorum]MBB4512588.1 hypothetical protein [Paraburkholderia fungorum]MBB6200494.1 hypothetical protein [Paraburkholderia fungorum]MBU7437839.1 hypothetical protein [Paraburkholderia fungorum]